MNMYTTFRSDRRKTPDQYEVRFLTYDDCLRLRVGQHVHVVDQDSRIGEVKIASIHLWKRKPDIRIGWKYGLYEYGTDTIKPETRQQFFVEVLGKLEVTR